MATQSTHFIPVKKVRQQDFASDQEVRWCPGCGDYAILATLKRVLPDLGIPREKYVFVSGIGCSSRFPYYMNTYGIHSIHGRAPTIATGIRLANPELSVWIITGDGDGLSIGGNHLIHIMRRNVNVNIILFNNEIYGLTKGQYSPTSPKGQVTKSSPYGSIDNPFNPIKVALASGATFVARTVDRDTKHMAEIFRQAARHKGVSFVEVYQNCIIFNDGAFREVTDPQEKPEHALYLEHGKPLLFGKEKKKGLRLHRFHLEVVELDDPEQADDILIHDQHNPDTAYATLLAELTDKENMPIPLGVFRSIEMETYEEAFFRQIETVKTMKGEGDLKQLMVSGDTWEVKA